MFQSIQVDSLDPDPISMSFTRHVDSVSEVFGIDNLCGPIAYSFKQPVPSFISVSYSEIEASYTVTVNTSSYSDDGSFAVTLVV